MPPSLPLSPVSSLGRILISGGATDGHEENKSVETMVRLVMRCVLSGGSGKLVGGDGWLRLFREVTRLTSFG